MEKTPKIYESPDGGKTVYERDIKPYVKKDTLQIEGSLVTSTPNDIELGAKVRKLYWDSKQK